ncbi:MAG: hypothetical protein V4484_14950 [Pseudomonadota bacterium]
MKQALAVHRNIVRAAMFGERKGWLLGWTVIALLLLVPAALFDFGGGKHPDWGKQSQLAFLMAALALFWWLRFVPGAVRQNSPANARLVPGLNRSVRRTTMLFWCLTLAPMAWLASRFTHPMLAFVVFSMLITTLGMARGGRQAGMVIYLR